MNRLLLLLAALSLTVCGYGMTREQAVKQAVAWRLGHVTDRSFSFVTPTGSMRPAITENAVLLLQRATGADLHRGDIAIYTRNEDGVGDDTICHRVTAISRNGWFYFAGDHNRYSDGWIAPCRIRWRVVQVLNFNP